MTSLCLMLVTRARVPWFQVWTYYGFMNICEFLILFCKSTVTYYVLWSGNPEVTIIGTTPGDDHSLRSSCIHYVLILCRLTGRWGGGWDSSCTRVSFVRAWSIVSIMFLDWCCYDFAMLNACHFGPGCHELRSEPFMNSSLYPCFRSDLASYSHLLRVMIR